MTKGKTHIAIIGGSGIYNLEGFKVVESHETLTPFGKPSGPIQLIEFNESLFYFVARHGAGHFIAPSEINYRANIFALKSLGAKYIVSVSAVGSLKEEHPPKKFVLPDQFIDWTKGKRERSFFGEGMVGHVSVAYPVEKNLQVMIAGCLNEAEIDHSVGGSYICIEGPQFSTRAESELYRSFGATVIGMTNVPEAFLAKEAGMSYATVAMVTDYDCWKEEHCSLEEILNVMGENYKSAQKLVSKLIPKLYNNPPKFEPENQCAVVTAPEQQTPAHKEILKVLLS
ncbi:MAG: S-methyl-5'-thioadenosine phosphorylase [Bacteriovoracaceae bacterium]|jgi:5'-methylthioadenosine phosphorylase|nr:S-methyl-5'-thioadenosine phosphorylase [Bacteriovoracaceae bacterium]